MPFTTLYRFQPQPVDEIRPRVPLNCAQNSAGTVLTLFSRKIHIMGFDKSYSFVTIFYFI